MQLEKKEREKNKRLLQFKEFENRIDQDIKDALAIDDIALAMALADGKNTLNTANNDWSIEGYDIDENNNVIKVYRCKFCPFSARQKRNLTRHLNMVHSINIEDGE